jgi:hypothetical protein
VERIQEGIKERNLLFFFVFICLAITRETLPEKRKSHSQPQTAPAQLSRISGDEPYGPVPSST